MPISSKMVINLTIVLLTVGLFALVGIVATTIWLAENAQSYAEEATSARKTRIAAVELRAAMQNAEASQRGYLIRGNEIYLAPYSSAKIQANAQLAQLKLALEAIPQTSPMMERLSKLVSDKIDDMDRTITLKRAFSEAEALSIFSSNRGKAIMDEANVFLSSIIRMTDERLTAGMLQQRRNAVWLRGAGLVAGLVIILVVGGVIVTIYRYTREVAQTRDQVQLINASLEQRVRERTDELLKARDKAEVLLSEVNHRVANSLAIVSSLVGLQSKTVSDKVAQSALKETQGRINAIAAVHRRLYNSDDTRYVDFEEYLSCLLENVETAMQEEGHGASLRCDLDALRLGPDMSVSLGVIVTELVTNSFKYAYPKGRGEVRVRLKRLAVGQAELVVEDDGIGHAKNASPKGTGLGTRIVDAMARTMGVEVEYIVRHPGFGTRLAFAYPNTNGN
jgi:two-component sensor histidine kinase/CHASE3 domain sensor protein